MLKGWVNMDSKRKKAILQQFGATEDRVNDLRKELSVCENPVLRELYEIEKMTLIEKLVQIEQAVMNMTNMHERRVLWLHYIGDIKNGKRHRLLLWQIANVMGYSYDWVKGVHGVALKNLKL